MKWQVGLVALLLLAAPGHGAVTENIPSNPGVRHYCQAFEDLAAADDNYEIWMALNGATITATSCHCRGTCSTPATLAWEDRAGNAMTGAPTCSTGSSNSVWTEITAGGSLVAGEGLAFDVTNTPVPETDEYDICFAYKGG